MTPDVKRDFSRMVAARKALVDLRGERMEQLLSVRAMLRELLADFFETLDPITNLRLAEMSADGSKSHGDLSIVLSFFEGTKLRIAVDVAGRFSHSVSIPSAFDDVERVVAIRVSADAKRAEVLYEPIGASGTFRSLDLVDVALRLLDYAVCAVEAELPVQPPRAVMPTVIPRIAVGDKGVSAAPRAPFTSSRIAAFVGGASVRTALGPSTATIEDVQAGPPHLSIAEPPPAPNILTFKLG
jgi:hypothetical protein